MSATILRPRDWQGVAREKRASIASRIAPYALSDSQLPNPTRKNVSQFLLYASFLTPAEKTITTANLSDLLLRLRSGGWSAKDVTTVYIKTTTVVHQLCNVLTEPNFDAALARAVELDAKLASSGPVGPLHGLPVTVKDQFMVTGLDTTIAYTALCGQPATTQSALIEVLEALGAIVIAKTTLPQSIMWGETSSPLFGLTSNPWNRDFTPGGSTGGEAVLLSMNGSPLGWGTDIGGSVRIPSAMMGTAGFRPSHGRLPYKGTVVSDDGQEHVPSVVGPMAKTVEGLVEAMRAVCSVDLSRIDPRVLPIKWREDAYQSMFGRKLRIGVIRDDGAVRVHPPVARALQQAVEKLRAAGHEVVEWAPDFHAEGMQLIEEFYTADGGEDIRAAVLAGGEPFLPHVEALVNTAPAVSVFQYWALNRRKWRLHEAYSDKWNASSSLTSDGQEVDLLLAPALPHVAVPHNYLKWVGYTKIWNLLDFPAGVFAVDYVSVDQDRITEEWASYKPRNLDDEINWKLYDPAVFDGHPIALQVVGRNLQDEKTLAGMKIIEEIVKQGPR